MNDFMKIYLTILALLVAFDSVWLGLVTRKVYKKYLGYLMNPHFNLLAACTFYLIYAMGILYLVIQPALLNDSGTTAFAYGVMLGLCAYGAYDLTNQATIKKWPWQVTLLDMAWGAFATGMVSFLVFFFLKSGY